MLLGFKRQFAPFVKNKTKKHTIRAKRKRPPKVGEPCHCYVDPRQKTMKLLGRWKCIHVEDIVISLFFNPRIPLAVTISGNLLKADEAEAFLWRDGFRGRPTGMYPATVAAAEHWKKQLKKGAFHGHLIHWDTNQKMPAPKGKR